MVYRITDINKLLPDLDFREKNGYTRTVVAYYTAPGDAKPAGKAIMYFAQQGDDPAYTGPAPLEDTAAMIARSVGPSGRNLDYLLNLHTWMESNNLEDEHLTSLAALASYLAAEADMEAHEARMEVEIPQILYMCAALLVTTAVFVVVNS